QRVGVSVVGVERIGAVPVELEGAARGGVGELDFARPLYVDAGLDGVRSGDLAEVVHQAVNGVAVPIRRAIAQRRVGGVGDAAERHIGDEVQRVERRVALRDID